MKEEITYRWRVQQFGKCYTTSFQATEAHIKKEHPEAVPVESTRRVQMVPETPQEFNDLASGNCTSGFLRDISKIY